MIRNAIAPIQAWLLSQGRCVGCGTALAVAKKVKHKTGTKHTCKCGRIFIKSKNAYRRALINEV